MTADPINAAARMLNAFSTCMVGAKTNIARYVITAAKKATAREMRILRIMKNAPL
jgi:hypothetical protein